MRYFFAGMWGWYRIPVLGARLAVCGAGTVPVCNKAGTRIAVCKASVRGWHKNWG